MVEYIPKYDNFTIHLVHGYLIFCSGRALTPQKNKRTTDFLSFIDNVPFDDTLRVKATHIFVIPIIHNPPKKRKRLTYIFSTFSQAENMGLIFIRAIIIFVATLIVMRLMGKRQIGEMQPFELVITLLIAEVAGTPMADISIPLLYGVVSVLALFILHQVLSLLGLTGIAPDAK